MSDMSIVVRTPSGLSGDMLVAGLARLTDVSDAELQGLVDAIGVPALADAVHIVSHVVDGVSGWHAQVDLPHAHEHRTQRSIIEILRASALSGKAKALAESTFAVLAEAEAGVHGLPADEVQFHEVGALDSILDICLASALLTKLAPENFWCSPLPICDGTIRCAHGLMASPAPAVQQMLTGIPIYGVDAPEGETVTPTAIAFLKAAGAQFGKWPACTAYRQTRVYGDKIFHALPNGALFFAVHERTAAHDHHHDHDRDHLDHHHEHAHA